MKILIAEDEVSIAKALKVMLEKNRYTVDMVYNGTDALDYGLQGAYDAMVLDVMMPGMNGLEVLRTLRSRGVSTPALFLTAKGEVEDRVEGLDAGADDYLPKPFASSEFLARVRALVRRSGNYLSEVLSVGNLSLDCTQYLLYTKRENVHLNKKEYQLMELFLRYPGHVFSSEHLMEKVWGLESEAEIDVVWTYIGFLRKKLKQIASTVEIRTIRGAGYALKRWRKHAEKITETFYTGFHDSVFCSDCRAFGNFKYLELSGSDGDAGRYAGADLPDGSEKGTGRSGPGGAGAKGRLSTGGHRTFAGPLKPEGEFSPEAQAMNRFFVIYYNEDSQVEKTDLTHVSAVTEEEAVALAETVLAAG